MRCPLISELATGTNAERLFDRLFDPDLITPWQCCFDNGVDLLWHLLKVSF